MNKKEEIDFISLNNKLGDFVKLINKDSLNDNNKYLIKEVLYELLFEFHYQNIEKAYNKIELNNNLSLSLLKDFSMELKIFNSKLDYFYYIIEGEKYYIYNKGEKYAKEVEYNELIKEGISKIKNQLSNLSKKISLKAIIYEILGNQSGSFSVNSKGELICRNIDESIINKINDFIIILEKIFYDELNDLNNLFKEFLLKFEKDLQLSKIECIIPYNK